MLGFFISTRLRIAAARVGVRGASGRLLVAVTALGMPFASVCAQAPGSGLTAVDGISVGHFTLSERPTGCTVVLVPDGAVAGVDVRGSAPGTREVALLDPVHTVQRVHAVVLSGGSAFGLAAADGVVRYLEERGVGYDMRIARVPIVPAAILYDLPVGSDPTVRPGADCGYRAAVAASAGDVEEGSVGAGAGATVGKLGGMQRAMKSGVGTAAIELPSGVVVAALVAVNAVGNVIDPSTGEVVAGMRSSDGRGLVDVRRLIREGSLPGRSGGGDNTTLGVVATNVPLTKAQATKIAQMAHDGFARTISPAHTPADGDIIFALSTGTIGASPDLMSLGALAAEVVADAVLRAVRTAKGLPGLPAVRELR
jgi:L-aminopeptidase/D-esterase-like protein